MEKQMKFEGLQKFKLKLIREDLSSYITEKEGKIKGPTSVKEILINNIKLHEEPEEVLILITLDTKNNFTGYFEVSRGSINSTIVSMREIFKRALLSNATQIIIAHNHPSGNVKPSREDIAISQRIKATGEILNVQCLDFVIIGSNGELSSLKELEYI